MAITKLNTNQLGNNEVVYSYNTLKSGDNTTIAKKQNQYVIDANTVACWHFDDDVTDVVSGRTITVDSGSITYTELENKFKFGKSLFLLNQASPTYSTAVSKTYTFSSAFTLSGEWSIDFWVSNTSTNNGFVTIQKTDGSQSLRISSNTGYPSNVWFSSIVNQNITNIPQDNKMHHIAFCASTNGTLYYFIDGHKENEINISSVPTAWTFNNILAAQYNQYYGNQATIDELRISDVCRWTSDFTVPNEPYAASAESDYYVVDTSVMTGATTLVDGAAGVVPAPAIADKDKFLKGDGTWAEVSVPNDIWTQTNLRQGDNTTISIKTNPYIIDDHTLACWHFDETNVDVISGATIPVASTYATTTGWYKFEKAAYIQYNQHYGDLPSSKRTISTSYNLFKNWTIDFWARTNNGNIIGLGNTNYSSALIYLSGYPNGSSFIRNNGVTTNLKGLPTDTLCHVAITMDNLGVLRQYIDGEKVIEADLSSSFTSWGFNALYAGQMATGSVSIDELRISDVCRWTEDSFEVPTVPYAESASEDYYVINTTVDSALSNSSKMPVQNKVVTTALATKQDTLTASTGIDITSNTISAVGVKETNDNAELKFWKGTESEYELIDTKDPNTLYIQVADVQ